MKLGLGTVQFGLNYGISNVAGQLPASEVNHILEMAKKLGFNLLDTAASYGSSEQVLGDILEEGSSSFRIVTKTPSFGSGYITNDHVRNLVETFEHSLQKLRTASVYGLLIHNADDLLANNGERLMEAMLELKSRGLVDKIGVSIYNGQQIESLLERYRIDLIQVPINVLDQRLANGGQLDLLKREGVEIHARSIFLQGLLLMPPSTLGNYFNPISGLVQRYHAELVKYKLSPLQGALAYVNSLKQIDYAVVGVTATHELQEIFDAIENLPADLPLWSEFLCDDEQMINPAMWPRRDE